MALQGMLWKQTPTSMIWRLCLTFCFFVERLPRYSQERLESERFLIFMTFGIDFLCQIVELHGICVETFGANPISLSISSARNTWVSAHTLISKRHTTGNLRSTELAHAVVFVLYIVTDLLPLNAKLHNTSIQLIQRRRLYVGVVFSEKISNKAAGRSCRFPSPPWRTLRSLSFILCITVSVHQFQQSLMPNAASSRISLNLGNQPGVLCNE